MAIYRLIANGSFGPDEIEAMTAAYEGALIDLGVTNRDDPITELIAKSIVNVTATGARDPVLIKERAINALGKSASVFVSVECIVCICQQPDRRTPIEDVHFFRERRCGYASVTREIAGLPPAMAGCRHAPISVNLGFTDNRPSHMRQVRRANVAHADRAGWTRLGEAHV